MSKIFFYYGTMNSSKTANLLMNRYNHETRNKSVLLIKPQIEDSNNSPFISTRAGINSVLADYIIPNNPTDYKKIVDGLIKNVIQNELSSIMIDECQFFSSDFINYFCNEVEQKLDITVYSYGLLKDYTGHLFKGSETWIENADKFIEVKTFCDLCDKKALFTIRNSPIEGGNIDIDKSKYKCVCRKHFL